MVYSRYGSLLVSRYLLSTLLRYPYGWANCRPFLAVVLCKLRRFAQTKAAALESCYVQDVLVEILFLMIRFIPFSATAVHVGLLIAHCCCYDLHIVVRSLLCFNASACASASATSSTTISDASRRPSSLSAAVT